MNKKIIILFNDAGAAEILTSMVVNEKNGFDFIVIADKESPAFSIAARKKIKILPRQYSINFYKKLIKTKPDYFFYGTSWSKKEYKVAEIFKKNNVPVIVFLDHWMDYRERFDFPKKGWEKNLPDFFATGDKWSYKIARQLKLPGVSKLNNYYLLDTIKEGRKKQNAKKQNLLFLSQSAKALNKINNFHFKDEVEYNIIKKLITNFPKIASKHKLNSLVIRIHPAQKEKNLISYKKLNDNIKLKIEKSTDRTLINSLNEAKIVLGLDTMALFISLLLNKPTYSLTPKNYKINLPIDRKHFNIDFKKLLSNKLTKIKINNQIFSKHSLREFLNFVDKKYENSSYN